jgi:hypothetical protein
LPWQVRNTLKKMDADLKSMDPAEASSATGRMKKQQQAALSRKFVEVWRGGHDVCSRQPARRCGLVAAIMVCHIAVMQQVFRHVRPLGWGSV